MGNSCKIKLDTNTVVKNMNLLNSKMHTSIIVVMDTVAKKAEEWAKNNAIWTDRTGNARQGLKGEAYWKSRNVIEAAVYHSVDYGVWLELAHQRKYAILEDAIEAQKDELLQLISELIEVK